MRFLFLICFMMGGLWCFAQNAIVNEYVKEIEISDINNMSIKETKSITILNENGRQQSIYYGYEDDFTKLTSLTMTVYNSEGKKVKRLGKGLSENWNINARNEIDNSEVVILDPAYQSYPYTIELSAETNMNKGFLSIPHWMPRNDFELEVKKATLSVTIPEDYKINYMLENIGEPTIYKDNNTQKWHWELTNMASVSDDMSIKQFITEQPKVYLGPLNFTLDGYNGSFESWRTFGEWYLALNSEPYEFGEETKAFLNSINTTDVSELVDQLYRFMQQRSRYISIQLGVGGFQSLPTKYVDDHGYGDCKALSNYMKSMLDYKGIASNFILVKAGKNEEDIKPELVSNQFNHVFLAVPNNDDTTYLECTTQLLPTGYTGTHTDDRYVLWIAENASQIMKMPELGVKDNILTSTGQLTLDQYGNGELELVRDREGYFFEDIQLLLSISEKQRESFLYNQFRYKDFVIDYFDYQPPKESSSSYTSKYKLFINNLARTTSDRILIPVHSYDQIEDYITYNRYKQFAEVRRAFTLEDKMIINLPEGFHMSRLPDIPEIESEFGTYTCEIRDLTDGRVEINRKVIIHKGRFMNEDYTEFSGFISEVKKADRSSMIITAGT